MIFIKTITNHATACADDDVKVVRIGNRLDPTGNLSQHELVAFDVLIRIVRWFARHYCRTVVQRSPLTELLSNKKLDNIFELKRIDTLVEKRKLRSARTPRRSQNLNIVPSARTARMFSKIFNINRLAFIALRPHAVTTLFHVTIRVFFTNWR